MLKIFGYTLYMSGTWWFGYLLIYLPIVASIANALHKRWRRGNVPRPIPWKVVGPILLVVLTFPLWDVLVTAVRAKPLCEKEAGIKVFRTVQADSVRDYTLTPAALAHGFRIAESYGPGNHKYRYSIRDGKIVEERIEEFLTRYSYSGRPDTTAAPGIRRHTSEIVDEQINEILSKSVDFSVDHGWFEAVVGGVFGLESNPWSCGRSDYEQLLFRTVLPKGNQEVEAK